MKNTNAGIWLLSITAAVLMTLNFFATDRSANIARAADSMKDRDFSMVTARVQGGSEALYVLDHRSGIMVVLTWDPAKKAMVVRDSGPLSAGR